MFRFIKKMLFTSITYFSFNLSNVNFMECVSMNYQECRTRTKIINISNNESLFYPFSIKVNKTSGSCNNINDPYAKLFLPDVIKNIDVKIFNLISWTNQKRHIEWRDTFKCKCILNASVCNKKME